jgi:hypothetical protein
MQEEALHSCGYGENMKNVQNDSSTPLPTHCSQSRISDIIAISIIGIRSLHRVSVTIPHCVSKGIPSRQLQGHELKHLEIDGHGEPAHFPEPLS